jgi:hypothetical protein
MQAGGWLCSWRRMPAVLLHVVGELLLGDAVDGAQAWTFDDEGGEATFADFADDECGPDAAEEGGALRGAQEVRIRADDLVVVCDGPTPSKATG